MTNTDPWTQPLSDRASATVISRILLERERAGPEAWRRLWPDDPLLLQARDRLSRLLRFHCEWPNELFIPRDNANAATINWEKDDFDAAEMVMEIEDAFDVGSDCVAPVSDRKPKCNSYSFTDPNAL